jgi:hypothetical protein
MPHSEDSHVVLSLLKNTSRELHYFDSNWPSVALGLIHFSRGVPLQFFSKKNYTILVVIQWCRRSEHQQWTVYDEFVDLMIHVQSHVVVIS